MFKTAGYQQLSVAAICWLLCINFITGSGVVFKTHVFEAEGGTCLRSCKQMMRSEASDGLTVLIQLEDQLRHSMTIKSNCSIDVGNVRYSTDGPEPITVNIILHNTDLGSFNTTSQAGNGYFWNVFRDSGQVGQRLQLPPGHYNLVLELLVSVDDIGVEIDNTALNFKCDGDPGVISTETPKAAVTGLNVSGIVGIVIAVATVIGSVVAIFSAGVAVYKSCKKRQNYIIY